MVYELKIVYLPYNNVVIQISTDKVYKSPPVFTEMNEYSCFIEFVRRV